MKQLLFIAFFFATFSLTAQMDISQIPLDGDHAAFPAVVERKPFFSGCELISDLSERETCSEIHLLNFLYGNMKYPTKAFKRDIKGKVVVTFIVDKDGSVTDASILEDIGGGCGKEVIRVVKSMPKWEPAIQNGKPCRVKFTVPVYFKIQ